MALPDNKESSAHENVEKRLGFQTDNKFFEETYTNTSRKKNQ